MGKLTEFLMKAPPPPAGMGFCMPMMKGWVPRKVAALDLRPYGSVLPILGRHLSGCSRRDSWHHQLHD